MTPSLALDIAQTAIAQAALRLARSTESEPVFNHSVRSYLFAELLAAHESMRPGKDYDSETLFLACVLHDLGAGTAAAGKERFEVEGADLAAGLLTDHNYAREVVDTVWEAIALHSSSGIAERRGPICYLVRRGVIADFGRNADFVDDDTGAAIHTDYPRMAMARSLAVAICAHAERSKEAAPAYSLPGELLREWQSTGTTTMEQDAPYSRWGE